MNYDSLLQSIANLHHEAVGRAGLAVSRSLVLRNWLIGAYLVAGSTRFPLPRKLFREFALSERARFRAHCPVSTGLERPPFRQSGWLLALAYRI